MYCWLIISTPIVPSPSHDVSPTTDDRPGTRKSGRITLVIKVPAKSSSPKLSSSGSNNPAKANTTTSSDARSKITAPVASPHTQLGPSSKTIAAVNSTPSTRVMSHNFDVWNSRRASLVSIQRGRQTAYSTVPTAEMALNDISSHGITFASASRATEAAKAIGIVGDPELSGIGIMNSSTPSSEGSTNHSAPLSDWEGRALEGGELAAGISQVFHDRSPCISPPAPAPLGGNTARGRIDHQSS